MALSIAIATTVSVGATSATAADGVCNLSVASKVSVFKPYTSIPVRLAGDCAGGAEAAWEAVDPDYGPTNAVFFEGTAQATWDYYDWEMEDIGYGPLRWEGLGAYSNDFETEYAQNSPSTDVRLGQASWLSVTRSNGVATLTGTSLRYSPDAEGFVRTPMGGVLQFREVGSATWQTLKAVYTDSQGVARVQYRFNRTRDYRFAVYGSPTAWNIGSATVRR